MLLVSSTRNFLHQFVRQIMFVWYCFYECTDASSCRYVVVQVQYKPTVRDRNGKRPAPAQKAKSIVTRVQNMDEVMRSRILNRAREVLNKHNCEGMERPSFESLETILLQNFESKDLARHRYALRTFLEGPEDVGVGPEVRFFCLLSFSWLRAPSLTRIG